MEAILSQLSAPPAAPTGISPGVVVILLGLLIGVAIVAVLWIVNRRGSPGGSADPSCGKCGYRVRGLTTFTCPECGSDLREVGIVGKAAVHSASRSVSGPAARTLSILFSDIKDFTARTAAGSRQTAVELVRHHRAVAEAVIAAHHGRVVKHIGDALLATFESATDGVLAGLEIQSRVRERNAAAVDAVHRFELRIAVSTGEVAVEVGDVFGDAVNLASRVQQVAPAGEVWVTETTAAMVNRREVACEVAGSFELKGVEGAVEVYRALPRVSAATVSS